MHDTTLVATDLQRTVLNTLKKNTERHPIVYSPYGHRRAESGLTSLLGFNGERPDPVTGHYLLGNGYRAFNPVLMRFNTPDNLSPFDKGGLNAYAYCNADPINNIDPMGTSAFSWLSKQLGMKSTYYGNGQWSKSGVTARKGRWAYNRAQEMRRKIQQIIDDAQLETFLKDRATVFAIGKSEYRPNGILGQETYKRIQSSIKSDIFENPKKIAEKFDRPYSNLIEKVARAEQANYRELFESMDNFNIIGRNTSSKLEMLERSFPNKKQILSYTDRIKSIIPKEALKLREEMYIIREKYLMS
ncbi:RHS repeat-associated core domain-containing protein [Pseudomonas sp. GM78]|uniref:RHS repeat-associated core domain-containing protein n=1 Tax=Pseudomonas sp. GM78 TaxID=1144337 RepID=UPI003083B81D